jgi:hypothetical protein
MGTRTYSRRRADGTRVPTALGIRTGKFTGGGARAPEGSVASNVRKAVNTLLTRGSPFTFSSFLDGRDSNPLSNLDLSIAPRGIISIATNPTGVISRGFTDELNQMRADIGVITGTERNRNALMTFMNAERMVNSATEAVSDVQSDSSLTARTPTADAVRVMANGGRISYPNASRILRATAKETERVLADNPQLTPVQQEAVRQIMSKLAGLAAVRSQVYDASMMNPNAPRGALNDFSGTAGRRLESTAKEVTRRAQLYTRALNRILGEPTGRILPPRNSTGGRVYSNITAQMGTIAHNSSLKMARENASIVEAARSELQEFVGD